MKLILTKKIRVHGNLYMPGQIAEVPTETAAHLIQGNRAIAAPGVSITTASFTIPKPHVMPSGTPSPVAVCITCHDRYLQYLEKQIKAVDGQTVKAVEKFLALDGCNKPDFVPADWQVLHYNAKSPNPGRNLAVESVKKADWIVFADADDVMASNYLSSVAHKAASVPAQVGIIYADYDYSTGRQVTHEPVLDYWQLRHKNCVSSCSGWRVRAIKEAGGWPNTGCYDDHSLALSITRLGYKAVKHDVPIKIMYHPETEHRSQQGDIGNKDGVHKWECRSFGIVTLLAGREQRLNDWINWFRTADLPPIVTLYVLDNSGNKEFGIKVKSLLSSLDVPFLYKAHGEPCKDADKEWLPRHLHVPALYNQILPLVNDDWLVMFEDDVIPPPDALRRLVNAFSYRAKHGAISAIYPSRAEVRNDRKIVVGAKSTLTYWGDFFYEDEITEDKLYEAGFIAGGFTLWENGIIKKLLPLRYEYSGNRHRGWDTNLSADIRAFGYRLFLHGGVWCQHITKEKEDESKSDKTILGEQRSGKRRAGAGTRRKKSTSSNKNG